MLLARRQLGARALRLRSAAQCCSKKEHAGLNWTARLRFLQRPPRSGRRRSPRPSCRTPRGSDRAASPRRRRRLRRRRRTPSRPVATRTARERARRVAVARDREHARRRKSSWWTHFTPPSGRASAASSGATSFSTVTSKSPSIRTSGGLSTMMKSSSSWSTRISAEPRSGGSHRRSALGSAASERFGGRGGGACIWTEEPVF